MSNLVLPDNVVWAPKYATKPADNARTEGEYVIRLAENFLVARDGLKAGEPLVFGEWQKWLTRNIFELNEDNTFRYKKVLTMIPRKNGKTFLMSIFLLYHLLTAPDYAEIYAVGKDLKQAKYVFEMLSFFIECNPELRVLFTLNKTDSMWTNKKTKAFFRPLPADAGKTHGINPYVIVADELHVWEGQGTTDRAKQFWEGLVSGSSARKNSQILVISTAGSNVYGSLLGELYLQGLSIVNDEIDDKSFGFFCWEADEKDDPLIYETWAKANPNLSEGLLDRPSFESALKTAMATGMAGFLRYYLNIWSRHEGDPYINAFYWQEAIMENYKIPEGAEITVGFDGAQSADTTAIVIQEIKTGFTEVYEFWEKDESDDSWAINRDDVEKSLIGLTKKYSVKLMWVDAAYWYPDFRKWKRKFGWPITEIAPKDSVMVPHSLAFLQDLVEGGFKHGNDTNLNKHAFRALARENGSFGKASKKIGDRIDILVASILANAARNWVLNKPKQEFLRLR